MTISLVITKENKDGSADAKVSFEKGDLQVLIQWGFIAMLKAGFNENATSDQISERSKTADGVAPTKRVKKTGAKKPALKKKTSKSKSVSGLL